ncbi:MAG: ATP-binding protein [Cyanobacteria bacterium P01_F01_bin.53]
MKKSPVSRLAQLSNDFLVSVLTAAVVISLVLVAIGSFNSFKVSQGFRDITRDFRTQQLSGEVIHLSEVLTMSARMAAATGDLSWEERYEAYEPILIESLEQAIALAPETYAPYESLIEDSNRKLINLNAQAFESIEQGNPNKALGILFSDTYKAQKELYADGIRQWSRALSQQNQANLNRYGTGIFWSGVFSTMSFWGLGFAWITVLSMVKQYIRQRKAAAKRLHRAKRELESSNQALQVSQAALLQKATTLEEILAELQETEGELADSNQALQVSKAALEQRAATLEEILEELQLAQVQMVQSEKMSSLGQLVAGVAHEINNPVNFIYANLEPIGEYVNDLMGVIRAYQMHFPDPPITLEAQIAAADLEFVQDDFPKILTSMEVGAERIRQIVLSLRTFSRSDEKGHKPADLHEGLDSTLVILEHRLKEQSDVSAITVVREYGNLPVVECNPGLINQVLMNVFTNAIDALDEDCERQGSKTRGKITVRTSAFEGEDGTEWVKIAITDTGIGIPEAIQDRVFDAFFTTKPVGKGTGIGLSISHTLVTKKHGGELSFTSTAGEGSEFVLELPVSRQAIPTETTEYVVQPPVTLDEN